MCTLLATLLVLASLSHCLPTTRQPRVPPVTRTEQSESAVQYGFFSTLRRYVVIITRPILPIFVIQPMGLNVIVNIY